MKKFTTVKALYKMSYKEAMEIYEHMPIDHPAKSAVFNILHPVPEVTNYGLPADKKRKVKIVEPEKDPIKLLFPASPRFIIPTVCTDRDINTTIFAKFMGYIPSERGKSIEEVRDAIYHPAQHSLLIETPEARDWMLTLTHKLYPKRDKAPINYKEFKTHLGSDLKDLKITKYTQYLLECYIPSSDFNNKMDRITKWFEYCRDTLEILPEDANLITNVAGVFPRLLQQGKKDWYCQKTGDEWNASYDFKVEAVRRAFEDHPGMSKSAPLTYNAFLVILDNDIVDRSKLLGRFSDKSIIVTVSKIKGTYQVRSVYSTVAEYILDKYGWDFNDNWKPDILQAQEPVEYAKATHDMIEYEFASNYMDTEHVRYIKQLDYDYDLETALYHNRPYNSFYNSFKDEYVPAGKTGHDSSAMRDRIGCTKEDYTKDLELYKAKKKFLATLGPDNQDLFDDLDVIECPECGHKFHGADCWFCGYERPDFDVMQIGSEELWGRIGYDEDGNLLAPDSFSSDVSED